MVQERVAAREPERDDVLDEAEWLLYAAEIIDGIAERLMTTATRDPGGPAPVAGRVPDRQRTVPAAAVVEHDRRLPRSPPH